MKTGILGGTFDPPHMGHIKLALAAVRQCGLDRLVLLPAANPPHKKSMTNPLHRRNMAAVAAEEYGFELCEIEYAREKPSYTVDTIAELEKLYPDDKLYFIIGGDSMLDFEKWHEWEKLINMCAFIVGSRSGAQKKQVEKAGILSEMKKRQHYEKPRVMRKKKRAAARKRLMKKIRKMNMA